MSGVKIEFFFDNPSCTYYSGQNVTGRLRVKLMKTKKLRSISLNFKGAANTSWTVQRTVKDSDGQSRTRTEHVTGYEEYFKLQFYVLGSSSGSQIQLPPGDHYYQFNCTLPPNLPSSFESDYGHIRYTIKAVLDRPWKFDHEAVQAFTVVSPLDLNQESNASNPVHLEMSKTFCCLCCASPPVTVNVSLPVRGYVPGQDIPVKVNVENISGVIIDEIRLSLYKKTTYRANVPRHDTKEETKIITEVSKGPIFGVAEDDYIQNVKVPPLPPSNLKHCGIIDLKYYMKVKAITSGLFRRNLSDKFEIAIGTIPVRNYQTPIPQYQATAPPIQASAPPPPGFSFPSAPYQSPSAPSYHDIPPPTYEESMFNARSLKEQGDSDHTVGLNSAFAPKYPVYNFARN